MSVKSQICFNGETDCHFKANFIKPNMCICMKDIARHKETNVNDEDVLKALEYTQKGAKAPSLILDASESNGKLFLGGYKAALNKEFLAGENVKAVVNTVGRPLFQVFGNKMETMYREGMSMNNVDVLYVEWEDSISFHIPNEDLEKVLRYMHENLKSGGSVFVHCAQGKSRSTTAVVAYLMVVKNINEKEALAFVKEKRKMAEPNSLFMKRLQNFGTSEMISRLRKAFV